MKITHLTLDLAPFSTDTVAAIGASALLSAQAGAGDNVVVVAASPRASVSPPPYLARRLSPLVVETPEGVKDVTVMEGLIPGCRARLFLLGLPDSASRAPTFGRAVLTLLPTLVDRPELVHLHDDTGSDVDGLRVALGGVTVVQSVWDAGSDSPSLVAAIQDADGVVVPCPDLPDAAPGRAVADALRSHPSVRVSLLGVDPARWNPARDTSLAATFSPEALSGKASCRAALQQRAGLPPRPDALVLAVWANHAGEPDAGALVEMLEELARLDVQVVSFLTAATGEPDPLGEALRGASFGWVAPDTSEGTLRAVLSGSDAVLLPDAVAPLGQRALIAMRYGLVPVARHVQAHRELLVEYDARSSTGGAFLYQNTDELFRALHRLVMAHRDKEGWLAMVRANALVEAGWSRPLSHMAEIYRKALTK